MPAQSDAKSGHVDSLDEHIDVAGTETMDEEEPFVETRHKRVVRRPRWMRDYFSMF